MSPPQTKRDQEVRIIVLGCAGTGKTTFTRQLSNHLGITQIVLDEVWPKKLTKEDLPLFRVLVSDLHKGDNWVSDGNFSQATFDIRLPRATLIVWLTEPRLKCCYRVLRRVFNKHESHKITQLFDVLRFIWRFDRVNRPLIESQIELYGPELNVLRTRSSTAFSSVLQALAEPQDTLDQAEARTS